METKAIYAQDLPSPGIASAGMNSILFKNYRMGDERPAVQNTLLTAAQEGQQKTRNIGQISQTGKPKLYFLFKVFATVPRTAPLYIINNHS